MQLEYTPMSFSQRRAENKTKQSRSWLVGIGLLGFFFSLTFIAELPLPTFINFRGWSISQWSIAIFFIPLALLSISVFKALLQAILVLIVGDKLIYAYASGFAIVREWQGWKVRIVPEGLFSDGNTVFSVPTTSRTLGWRQPVLRSSTFVTSSAIIVSLLWFGISFPTFFSEKSLSTLFYYALLLSSVIMLWVHSASLWINDNSPLPADPQQRIAAKNRKKFYPLFSASHDFGFATDKSFSPDFFIQPQDGSINEAFALLDNFELALNEQNVIQAASLLNRLLEISTKQPLHAVFEHIICNAAIFEAQYGRGVTVARDWLSLLPPLKHSLLYIESVQLRSYTEVILLQCEGKRHEALFSAQRNLQLLKRRFDSGFAKHIHKQLLTLFEDIQADLTPQAAESRKLFSLLPAIKTASLSLVFYGFTILMVTSSIASPEKFSQPSLIGNISFALGQAAFLSGDAQSAAWLFEYVISRSPEFVPAHQGHADSLLALGEFDQAISELKFASSLTQDAELREQLKKQIAETWYNRGYELLQAEQYEQSAEAYTQSLIYQPNWSYAYSWRGYVRGFQHQWAQAISDYDKSIQLQTDGKSTEIYKLRAEAKWRLKQYDEAIADYQFVLEHEVNEETKREVEEDLARVYFDRGDEFYKAANYKESLEQFTFALQYQPNWHRAHWFRGASYGWLKDYERSIEEYNLALQKNTDDDWQIYSYRASAFVAQAQYDQAIEDYSTSIALMPAPSWDVYFDRAATYLLINQKQAAEEDFLYIYEYADSEPTRDRALREINKLRKQK